MVMGGMPRSSVPTESAWVYIKRSLPLLRPLRGFVLASIGLGFIVTLLPFVTPAVWGPIVAILGQVGGKDGTGSLQGIWDVTGPR